MLTKSQRVFGLDMNQMVSNDYGDGPVIFNFDRDEGDDMIDDVLLLSVEDWQDLGSPVRLTVTIEPGDLLNA